jgi:hypothetical protein
MEAVDVLKQVVCQPRSLLHVIGYQEVMPGTEEQIQVRVFELRTSPSTEFELSNI